MPSFGPVSRKDLVRYLRKLEFEGHFLGVAHLVADRAVLGAATDRKVVARDYDLAAVDASATEERQN